MFRTRRALERENRELRAALAELHALLAEERQEMQNRPTPEGRRAVLSSPSEGRINRTRAGRFA